MKISKIELIEEHLPLKTPFVTAKRSIDIIISYVLKITTDDGCVGYGACSPTPVITGDTIGSLKFALTEFYPPLLIGKEVTPELLEFVQNALVHNTSPKAALDIALHDLLAQKEKKSLFTYLGSGNGDQKLITDITISLGNIDKMVADTIIALSDGFSKLKIKLGTTANEDIARIKALAEVIPDDIAVRLDANQAWSPEDAVKICDVAAKSGMNIELIEQPVKYSDFKGMKYVTANTDLMILADESVFSVEDAERILDEKAADMINIKLMKCGGIYNAKKIFDIAKSANVECMLGCMMEGTVSVAAASHFAAAVGITKLDLDPPTLCKSIPTECSVTFESENIYIKDGANDGKYGLAVSKISQ